MKPIVTLSLNPSIDGAAQAETVRPIHKIRTSDERYDPGGGGINAARVVHELGGKAFAIYLAGGATGGVLDDLLQTAAIPRRRIPIGDHTRISHAVYERSSGLEFRFCPKVRWSVSPSGERVWQRLRRSTASISSPAAACRGAFPRISMARSWTSLAAKAPNWCSTPRGLRLAPLSSAASIW